MFIVKLLNIDSCYQYLMFKRLLTNVIKKLTIFFFSIFLMGCTNFSNNLQTNSMVEINKHSIDLNNLILVKSLLKAQHKEWKSTKYRIGGLSKKGIDCSGFVYITFRSKFKIELPRTTRLQAKIGVKVSKKNLRIGDLIFFKTGIRRRHVGIYIGKLNFLHASSKKGVTISTLKNSYWASKYWKIKRLNPKISF